MRRSSPRMACPSIVIPAKAAIQLRLCPQRQIRGSSPRMTCPSIVIPAKAEIQLHTLRCSKLDPDFRQGDEEK